jgi:hypothetical protein
VLFAFVSLVVVAAIATLTIFAGSVPARESAGYARVILPLAFGAFLIALTLSSKPGGLAVDPTRTVESL